MIIEGLLTTQTEGGEVHLAPMGPVVNEQLTEWTLRPFQSSTTFQNLRAHPHAVFHVVDDVLPMVQFALGNKESMSVDSCDGVHVLTSACHWYRLEIVSWDVSQPRSEAVARVVQSEQLRPFWGWNRAKHMVLEATILMTRRHLIEDDEIRKQMDAMQVTVDKTAGSREKQAWTLLRNHLDVPS